MANTITNFYTFTDGTAARAAEVNNNFSNFRGDLIPINTDTQTSSDAIHDLGQSSHRWLSGHMKTLYLNSIYLGATTTNWKIDFETSTSDLVVSKSSSEKFRVATSGEINNSAIFSVVATTSTYNFAVTTSGAEVLNSGYNLSITVGRSGQRATVCFVPNDLVGTSTLKVGGTVGAGDPGVYTAKMSIRNIATGALHYDMDFVLDGNGTLYYPLGSLTQVVSLSSGAQTLGIYTKSITATTTTQVTTFYISNARLEVNLLP